MSGDIIDDRRPRSSYAITLSRFAPAAGRADTSGDVATAEIVTADTPTETADILPATATAVPQSKSARMLSRLAVSEQAIAEARAALTLTHFELAATKASTSAQLRKQEQDTFAKTNLFKDKTPASCSA